MYKAQQEALFQATNQQLVNIRQQEIGYYTSVNAAIGSQAALIGGFTYGIYTQNQPNADKDYSKHVMTGYYIASAITIAFAVHVIINTMLLQVMGPGLALNGPIGSMARAAEGMKVEQDQVIYAFAFMMIFFSIATTLSFWAVMDSYAAFVSTIVLIIGARTWYKCSKRVYYRLHWSPEDSWVDQMRNSEYDPHGNNMNATKPAMEMSTLNHKKNEDTDNKNGTSNANDGSNKSGGTKFFSGLFSGKSKESNDINDNGSSNNSPTKPIDGNSSSNKVLSSIDAKKVAMQGYLVKRGQTYDPTALSSKLTTSKWERRYFVLLQNGYLYYYKTRQDYRDDPNNTLKERPLELSEYKVTVLRSSDANGGDDDNASIVSGMTTASGKTSSRGKDELKMIFQMELIPVDEVSRKWSLRCDTEEELDAWIEVMQEISPSSFENSK